MGVGGSTTATCTVQSAPRHWPRITRTDALPKIWNTTFPSETVNIRSIDYRIPNSTLQRRVEGSRGFKWPDGQPLPSDLVPEYAFFRNTDPKEYDKIKVWDLMIIVNGLLLMSEKLRDLLLGFDMGTTLTYEVPLYKHDQKTLLPGRWFILHITANKKTVIPELSENVKEALAVKGYWSPSGENDVLAVRADAAQGADLWIDPHFDSRLFLSDRLKSALKPAGIRVKKMPMRPCTVIA